MTIYEKIQADKTYLFEILSCGCECDYMTLAWKHYCSKVCKARTCETNDCDQYVSFDTVLQHWLNSEIEDENESK